MMTGVGQPRPKSFYVLGAFFLAFLTFMYGPMIELAIDESAPGDTIKLTAPRTVRVHVHGWSQAQIGRAHV